MALRYLEENKSIPVLSGVGVLAVNDLTSLFIFLDVESLCILYYKRK